MLFPWPVRYLQMLMLMLALSLSFAIRVYLSVAIVAMTDVNDPNAFVWDTRVQTVLLSSFFWGYILLAIPGGLLASVYGGRIMLIVSMAISGATSFAIPIGAIFGDWQAVCVCRVLQGVCQGVLVPSAHDLIAKWSPKDEKSRIGALVYAGVPLGLAMQNLSAGLIAHEWGWAAIFYVNGGCVALWLLMYGLLGASSPAHCSLISDAERDHILTSIGEPLEGGEVQKRAMPWRAVSRSVPFLAVMVSHMGHNWGFFTLITLMPTYMARVLGANIKKNGILSALPYFALCAASIPMGFVADYLVNKEILDITKTRKLFNSIGLYGAALPLICISYLPPGHEVLAVALLVLCVGLNAGHYSGFMLVHIDMSRHFAGTLIGITNFFGNIMSLIAPLIAGVILVDKTDVAHWRTVFWLASIIYIVSNTFFVAFASCERQPWDRFGESLHTLPSPPAPAPGPAAPPPPPAPADGPGPSALRPVTPQGDIKR